MFFIAPADFESSLKLLKDKNFFEREKFFKMNIESEREKLLKDKNFFEREKLFPAREARRENFLGGHFSDFHVDFRPRAIFLKEKVLVERKVFFTLPGQSES